MWFPVHTCIFHTGEERVFFIRDLLDRTVVSELCLQGFGAPVLSSAVVDALSGLQQLLTCGGGGARRGTFNYLHFRLHNLQTTDVVILLQQLQPGGSGKIAGSNPDRGKVMVC